MSKKKGFEGVRFESTLGDIKRGASRYVAAMVNVLEKVDDSDPMNLGKEIVYMGYALGVVAGKSSDFGVEGFTVALNGLRISLEGEARKEEIQYPIWDKNGNLHTSEEGFRTAKGGES